MEITEVRVTLVDAGKLKAYVNITIDGCFMVRSLKVIETAKGLLVAMPNKEAKNGMFRDIAHPINAETRRMIETRVLNAYTQSLKL